MNAIPYGRHDINQTDIDAVNAVLKSDFLTQGSRVPEFEGVISKFCGAQYSVAVNSATSALHIACLSLEIGVGDCVWTSPITFVATANCVLYCGATVDFVDIDPVTYNLSVDRLAEKLSEAKKVGQLPKAVIAVHFAGQSCDMLGIHTLSLQYGFTIIEDASHAIGGKYKSEQIGNCRYSDITVFSFHPVKIITTGEGGMATTNNKNLATRMRQLRSHGIVSLESELQPSDKTEIWNYQQIGLGFNYRLTDIQAALGISQMQRLEEFIAKRHAIAQIYNQLLSALPVQIPVQHPDNYSSYHLYVIRLRTQSRNRTQREVYDSLRAANIQVNLHYIPVYRQPYYERFGFSRGYCLEAERYYSEAITIPIYSALSEMQQTRVVLAIQEAVGI